MKQLLSVLALTVGTFAVSAAERTNVVLILADDLGWADLGCYGSTYHKTPNLDRFAKESMRFTHGYASCPVCSPTRCSVMTGKYPQRIGITDWLPGRADRSDQKLKRPQLVNDLPASETTIAAAFKKAGYVTGLIGKWHLGGKDALPEDRGFDVNIGGDQTGTPLSYFAAFVAERPRHAGRKKPRYLTDRFAAGRSSSMRIRTSRFPLLAAQRRPRRCAQARCRGTRRDRRAAGNRLRGDAQFGRSGWPCTEKPSELSDRTIVIFTRTAAVSRPGRDAQQRRATRAT
jgi:arylsulfatase A-like enzyme